MNAEQWSRISALFQDACERPPADRERWLSAHCDDALVRAEVLAMLRTYDTDPDFLEQPADVGDGTGSVSAGRRLGPYLLVAELGRGGMGIVYEARRDDDQFDRRVAIKVLPAWSGSDLASRFRLERRVLAGLDHPGIARLLDSGVTGDGTPYFVMDYVDGRPVDAWAREQEPDLARRVALIEKVLDALGYAHQNLVVHRDVKPANVLVTADGEPKLLDFGIAALLTAEGEAAAGMTRTGHHSFTTEYASPEQIRGERVTTASDVYSVGVLLYLLLSGRRPYDLANQSPLEAMRIVCEVEPPLMSTVAGGQLRSALGGDLDAIVAKALRKAPAERYRSVAEFAADLAAWRTGRAVSAARQSFAYNATRFIRRHRAAVAAAAAILITLTGGVVATAWQARIAAQERDKAQNRFRQVQEFSRSLLFDVHSALRAVPGATESRRLLLDRAVQFLDGLAADAGEDAELQLELASGYQQLANVQGNELSDNVGNTAAALGSFAKATTLVDAVRAREPDNLDALIRAIGVTSDLASVQDQRGDPEAAQSQARHESLVRDLEARATTARAAAAVARGYSDIGRFRTNRGDFDGAEQAYREAVARFDAVPGEPTIDGLRDHAFALKRLGGVLLRAGKFDDSERAYRQALAIDEDLARRDPGSQTRYDITFTLSDLGLVQSRRGQWPDAIALWKRALVIRQETAASNPKDIRALGGVATIYGRLGGAAREAKDFAGCVAIYRDELRVRNQLIAVTGRLPGRVAEQAWARLRLAEALLENAGTATRSARADMIAEARDLVRGTGRDDGKVSVTAGSPPGFIELHDRLTARLAAS
jgi:non-specific serine/threonine protein kinase/serine/threonine-protein kinase